MRKEEIEKCHEMSAKKQRQPRVQHNKVENPTLQERRAKLAQPKSERQEKVEIVIQY